MTPGAGAHPDPTSAPVGSGEPGPPAGPGLAGVAELVAVMDRLRSPGGCPWDAEQTHESLAPYAVEEAYELAEAALAHDRAHLREELGDLLLQVVFHARVAQEDPADPFDLDDVATGIAAKLRRRHPHVFADGDARTPDEVAARWEDIKAEEKPHRTHVLDGIPVGMPPLERAAKVVSRLDRHGRLEELRAAAAVASYHHAATDHPDAGDDLGRRLLALVLAAHDGGVDPSQALSAALAAALDSLPGLEAQRQ